MGESNGLVTPPDNQDGEPTITVVGTVQIRRQIEELQTQAHESDEKVRELNQDADAVARRAQEAKAGLATLTRR